MKKQRSDTRTIFGVTMSKQGWNNVIIYAVLLLMFVLYFTGHDNRETRHENSIEPFADQIMVELSDHEHQLVRVGNRWQLQQGSLSEEQQQRWLQAWQQLRLTPHDGLLEGREYAVEITLADTAQPLHVTVFFTAGTAFVALPGYDHVFRVTNENAGALRPNG